MSNRYTAKVAESLKLRGWIDEIQAKALRVDNARLKCERDEANLFRERNRIALNRRDAQLATYKAAVVEAREALMAVMNDEFHCGDVAKTHKALHTLSALTGEAHSERQ